MPTRQSALEPVNPGYAHHMNGILRSPRIWLFVAAAVAVIVVIALLASGGSAGGGGGGGGY